MSRENMPTCGGVLRKVTKILFSACGALGTFVVFRCLEKAVQLRTEADALERRVQDGCG